LKHRVTINDATSRDPLLRWRELREYKDFLALLVWRELHLRYRHTLIGVGWSFLNPLLTMAVFVLIVPNLVSHEMLKASTGGVPYSIFVYCGMAPWACFSHTLTRCNTSFVDQWALLKNMYFPRFALPFAKVLAALAELLISLVVLFLLMAAQRVWPSHNLFLLPLFLLPLTVASTGIGLFLAILQVRYRDIYFILQFCLQLGLLVTPIWFPTNALPPHLRWILALNPMTGVVEGFRWAVLGTGPPSIDVVAVSTLTGVILLLIGLKVFQSRQETVADYV